MQDKINVFILGARGYTKNYGGWETLVHGLIDNWKNLNVHFYVFERVKDDNAEGIVALDKVTCIRIAVKQKGSSAMMVFDAKCTRYALKYIKENKIENPLIYYLGLRIGPLVWLYRPLLRKNGIILLENPAGLEWKRTKWNKLVQLYTFFSAYFMAHAVDYMICDAEEIRKVYNKMIKTKRPKKEYISYGSYPVDKVSDEMPEKVKSFFDQWGLKKDDYYLILGRYIPENNYEMMFKGFIASNTTKKLLVITNYKTEIQSFHKHILETTNYENDSRVKMVGTVYDKELLNYIRQYARGYIHGHSVGGTNPGLLEAMSQTKVNILFGCPFNREVGANAAVYFDDEYQLKNIIESVDLYDKDTIEEYSNRAKRRMKDYYSWDLIVEQYNTLFTSIISGKGL